MSGLKQMFGLHGKTALVTGSTAGIGKAVAKAFVEAGATVFVNGRKPDTVQAVVDELNALGADGKAVAVPGDVGSDEGFDAVVKAVQAHGVLDILVNNVGIFGVMDFFEIKPETWRQYFDTNVLTTARLSQAFLKPMLDRGGYGRVITISSEAGIRGFPSMAQYAFTKAAQLNLSRSMAGLTKGHKNITSNTVCPGPTWTEGVQAYMEGVAAKRGVALDQAVAEYFSENEPTSLKQAFLSPEEISAAVLFLASPSGSGVNGSSLLVDGGIVQHQ